MSTTELTQRDVEDALGPIVRGARRIARYAYPLGILTGIALTVLAGYLW